MMRSAARPDRPDGLGWATLGAAMVLLSARMDRLAEQGVPPFAAPGLLPGLLGLLMLLSGALLALRRTAYSAAPARQAQGRRLVATVGLCLAFSVGLVGHGLPFWLAASIFVSTAILVLQTPTRRATERGLNFFAVAVAIAIGVGVGAFATLVFQYVFLVQLP